MQVSVLVGDLREPELQGKWVYELRLILISNRLTIGEATAVLAHELIHAKLDHRGRLKRTGFCSYLFLRGLEHV